MLKVDTEEAREDFRNSLRENIAQHIPPSVVGVEEGTDPRVSELAGALIAAGPEKVGQAISDLDAATEFPQFVNHIDASGIKVLLGQINAGAMGVEDPGMQNPGPQQQEQPPQNPDQQPMDQELGSL